MTVRLKNYDNNGYHPGAGLLKRLVWFFMSALLFESALLPVTGLKCRILRWFGANIGDDVIIKPRVTIKYPWFLSVGDNVWIGEGVWIDNLTWVCLASDVCLSQGAYLLTGNHNYRDPGFKLIIGAIVIEAGAWVGAKAVVCPGISIGSQAVVTVASVLTGDALPNAVYSGNPAMHARNRFARAADPMN